MRIGEKVIYGGRVLVLVGLDPMSLPDGRAELQDPKTGERLRVPIAELEPRPPGEQVSRPAG
jgi:hypothetical protein